MNQPSINLEDFAAPAEPIDMEQFAQKAEQAAMMKHQISTLKEQQVALDKDYKRLCAELCEMMLESGLEKASVAGLSIKPEFGNDYFKAKGVSNDDLFAWLNEHDLGDIIKPAVHFKTLSSSVQIFINQGGTLDPEIINESPYKKVAIRGLPEFLEAKGIS